MLEIAVGQHNEQNDHHFADHILNSWIKIIVSQFSNSTEDGSSGLNQLNSKSVLSVLIQVMAWHQAGAKPLPEAVMTQFVDAYLAWSLNELTHWGRDNMAAIFQTTFSNAFSWMKMYKFRWSFQWSLFPGFQFTIFQH